MLEAQAVIPGQRYELVISTTHDEVTAEVIELGQRQWGGTPEWIERISRDTKDVQALPNLLTEAAQAWSGYELMALAHDMGMPQFPAHLARRS